MDARTPQPRARARALRAALSGVSALILLAGVALPLGFSPSSLEPFQKAAYAKGGGPGGGVGPGGDGPPGLSGGGNGGGNGNGNGGLTSSGHDGEDGHEKDKLGKLNAANASLTGLRNANPDSTVGQLYIYKQRVLDGELDPDGDGVITSFQQAIDFLDDFANKLVDDGVVAALNELLGLGDPFPDDSEDPEPEG